MPVATSLAGLWSSAPPARDSFPPRLPEELPEPARRYLEHAVAPGTPLAGAVRLRMHGEIKLNLWRRFTAEQVIRRDGNMIWRARTRFAGIPVSGYDRLVDGEAAQRWKMLGIIPAMKASGPDITRSTAGRLIAESIWLPSILAAPEVLWRAVDERHVDARLTVAGETGDLRLELDDAGAVRSLALSRWGNPGDTPFHYEDFGGVVEDEATFGGFTIPSRLRAGWQFGSAQFEESGEFFRVTVDSAEYG